MTATLLHQRLSLCVRALTSVMSRKTACIVSLFSILAAMLTPALAQQSSPVTDPVLSSTSALDDVRWEAVKKSLFGETPISSGKDIIAIDVPPRALDAALVPVIVEAKIPQDPDRYIRKLHLIVDKNPIPLAGIFEFSDKGNSWASVETRLRINEFTNVRAIVELNDGSMHMDSSFIKAAGGCSAPAVGDMDAARARAGKMRVKLRRTDLAGTSDTAEALLKISHPNNSGMQYDQVNKQYIPAYFVHTIGAKLDDEDIIKVTTNFSMSENPTVHFKFKPGTEEKRLKIYAVDSDSKRYEHEVKIKGTAP